MENPYDNASFLNRLLLLWITPLIQLGAKKVLSFDDIPRLPKEHNVQKIHQSLYNSWSNAVKRYNENLNLESNKVVSTDIYSKRSGVDGFAFDGIASHKPQSQSKPHLLRALMELYGKEFLVSGLVILPFIAVILIQPYFITYILDYIIQEEDSDSDSSTGDMSLFGILGWSPLGIATLSGILMILSMLSINLTFYMVNNVDIKVRTGLMTLLFDKCLRLSVNARSLYNSGEILTLMSVDMERVWFGVLFAHWIWVGPLCMISSLVSIGLVVGMAPALSAAGAGIFILCVFFPLGRLIASARRDLVLQTEHRMKLINESLLGIRVVKMYSWEVAMQQRIDKARELEMVHLRAYLLLRACNTVFSFAGSTLMAFVVMVTYTQVGGELTIQKTYSIFAFLNVLRIPLAWMPYAWTFGNEAITSLNRMTDFILLEECGGKKRVGDELVKIPNTPLISLVDCSYAWNLSGASDICSINSNTNINIEDGSDSQSQSRNHSHIHITLQHINLVINRGEFVAVVGAVGSGKSSLLSALLGHMQLLNGVEWFGNTYRNRMTKPSLNCSFNSNEEHVCSRVGYVTQDHWIQNMTLKDNILFGEDFDATRYKAVLSASQLDQDLCNLPHGDRTEIGERGINLSGGQKARVSVARALYASGSTFTSTSSGHVNDTDRDIDTNTESGIELFLFDDSLASVDVHVAQAMFHDAFEELLQGKTRVVCLSSHYQFLPRFDKILVLQEGSLVYVGGYDGLAASFPQYVTEVMPSGEEEEEGSGSVEVMLTSTGRDVNTTDTVARPATPTGQSQATSIDAGGESIMVTEDLEKGAVTTNTYLTFASGASGADGKWNGYGYFAGGALLILFATCHLCRVLFDMWIGVWSTDNMAMDRQTGQTGHDVTMIGNHHSHAFYFHWYITLFGAFAILTIFRAYLFIRMCLSCSTYLYMKLITALFSAPINTYFDVTPVGRILNRFSEDLDAVDSILPDSFLQNLQNIFFLLSAFIMCVVVTPYFLFILIPFLYCIIYIQNYFRKTSRELKRMDRVTRSPVFSLFGEMFQGLLIVRAYGTNKVDFIFQQFLYRVERNMTLNFHFWMTNRWLSLRIDILSAVIYMTVTIFAVLQTRWGTHIDPNIVGIALIYTLQLTGIMQHSIRAAIETENGMTSVERLIQFSNIGSEEKFHLISDSSLNTNSKSKQDPVGGTDWPVAGKIVFSNLKLRYRPGLELILKGINVTIPGGSKVGIVGRTGAGKSSLMLALFRLVEPEDGTITIDGLDICSIGLHTLRSRLTIIPQDPIMFSGTLRYNLDPFDQYTDTQLWEVLERVQLKELFVDMNSNSNFHELKLNYTISERGENISVGQRQLICIARALLRKSKIIILDEATASVDGATDTLIQETIKKEFANCTVLTIAHRLETIMDSDMIIVLEHGLVVEFGSPGVLLNHTNTNGTSGQYCGVNGTFKGMVGMGTRSGINR